MKKKIKKEIDEIENTIDWIEREKLIFIKADEIQFLQAKTLIIIAKQNEEIIKLLGKIVNSTTRCIPFSR